MNKPADILIVDDVAENLRLLAGMLKESGHHVRPVTSGSLALQAARHLVPDLILLDVKMPGMDGLKVCAELKTDPALRDIPVIFISALHETEDKLRAFQAGGVDYVTKPFQMEEVRARVATHLELRRQRILLAEQLHRLQELEQLRDSLTHMIVHDMRSPLMSMGGYLDMLERYEAAGFSGEGRDYLAQARANVGRLVRMASDMLTVSKLEAGALELNRSGFALGKLVREELAGFAVLQGRRRLEFTQGRGDFTVQADGELIGRVIQNLVSNALKFSPEDGMVRVRLMAAEKRVRLEVSDQGPGIPAGKEGKIFQKFGRLDRQCNRSGTGLGLAFCKLAVEAHGGEIGVESTAGKGSTFWFTLPPSAPARP